MHMYAVKKNHTQPLEVRLVLREKHGLWHLMEIFIIPPVLINSTTSARLLNSPFPPSKPGGSGNNSCCIESLLGFNEAHVF